MNPLGSDRMAGERGWLVSTIQVILSSWLLKPSSEVTLWWTFIWGINIFIPFTIQKSLSTYLFPRFHHHHFLILFFLNPWPCSPTIGQILWMGLQFHIWPFLLLNKVNNEVHHSNFCPLGGFLFIPFTDVLEKSWHAVMPVYHTEVYMNQAWIFSSLSADLRRFLIRPKGSVEVRTMDTWATSCSLLCFQWLLWLTS
jgi:hypothetical protein